MPTAAAMVKAMARERVDGLEGDCRDRISASREAIRAWATAMRSARSWLDILELVL